MFKSLSLLTSIGTTGFLTIQYIKEPYNSTLDKMIKFFYGQYRDYITLEKETKIIDGNLYHLSFPKFFFKIPKENFFVPGIKIEEINDPEIEEGGSIYMKDDYQNVFNIQWTPNIYGNDDKQFLKSIEFQNDTLKKIKNLDLFFTEKINEDLIFSVYRNQNYFKHPNNYFLDHSSIAQPSNELYVGSLYFRKDKHFYSISFHYSNMLINYAILKKVLENSNQKMLPPNHSKEKFEEMIKKSTFKSNEIIQILKNDLLSQKIKFIKSTLSE